MADTTDKDRAQRQKENVRKAKRLAAKALRDAPVIRCRFQHIEMPGVDLDFSFQGIQNYHLVDGQVYDLPQPVVEHLNSLTVPVYKQYTDDEVRNTYRAEPADPSERIQGRRNRFSLIPLSIAPGPPQPMGADDGKQPAAAAKRRAA